MSNHRYNNKLRVIAGQWRGRVIQFKPGPGVRPTPDRVRETVFNWLRPRIEGAHCLDLFAGSGLLGIEALSQGAKSSTFLDNSKQNIQTLRKNLAHLNSPHNAIYHTDTLKWLQTPSPQLRYDIVFVDPPFHQNFVSPCCQLLKDNHWLAQQATLYLETEPDYTLELPESWSLLKQKKHGQTMSYLIET